MPDHPLHLAELRVREHLVGQGLYETRRCRSRRTTASGVRVQNPLADDEPYLRSSLLDTLARRAEYNLNRMEGDVRLFEVGHAFLPSGGDRLPLEEVRVAALLLGPPPAAALHRPGSGAVRRLGREGAGGLAGRGGLPGRPPLVVVRQRPALRSGRVEVAVAGRWGPWRSAVARWTSRCGPADAFGVELTLGVMPSADVAPAGQHALGGGGSGRLPYRMSCIVPSR